MVKFSAKAIIFIFLYWYVLFFKILLYNASLLRKIYISIENIKGKVKKRSNDCSRGVARVSQTGTSFLGERAWSSSIHWERMDTDMFLGDNSSYNIWTPGKESKFVKINLIVYSRMKKRSPNSRYKKEKGQILESFQFNVLA